MSLPAEQPDFRVLGEDVVHTGPVVSLARATVRAPDGHTYDREIVHHPGAVSVVPIVETASGPAVVLVRQFRAPIGAPLLEIPAGKCDVDGEAPELTAARELAEETGFAAGRMIRLVGFYNSPGFCDEHSIVYCALDLREGASSAQGVEEEHLTLEIVPLSDVPAMIADGRLADGKSIIGLLLAIDHLRR